MKKLDKKYRIFIIVFVLIAYLTILHFTLKERHLTSYEKVVKDSFLTIQKIIYKPFQVIGQSFNTDIRALKKIEQEYLLQKELIEEQKATIEELKQTLSLDYTLEDYTSIHATVIKRNIDNFYETIVIDKGEQDGIESGMAVIANGSLIGLIGQTSYQSSEVNLLSSSIRLSVKIRGEEKEIYGIIKEYKENMYIMEGISENTKIEEGMEVYTTGLGHDIPSGILVGVVSREEKDHFDLNRTIYIKPTISLDAIYYVQVLKRNLS